MSRGGKQIFNEESPAEDRKSREEYKNKLNQGSPKDEKFDRRIEGTAYKSSTKERWQKS